MFKKHKEFIVNFLIVVAALGIVWNIWSYFRPNSVDIPAPAIGSEFKVTEFNPAGSQINVLLFLRTGCTFCDQSMPFYRRITQLSNTGKVKVIAFFAHNDLEATEYMKRSQLIDVEISRTNFDSLGIKGTPTFVLLDQSGKVLKSSVGKLNDKGEQEIENYLKSVITQ
ncbi:MAG TPA: redoxin family protein [Pyrinomonadaceae bacterium]|nr:redoxin family protein [Pyrinomonadaceae bacterium]